MYQGRVVHKGLGFSTPKPYSNYEGASRALGLRVDDLAVEVLGLQV